MGDRQRHGLSGGDSAKIDARSACYVTNVAIQTPRATVGEVFTPDPGKSRSSTAKELNLTLL
jgi:hypothetical protein